MEYRVEKPEYDSHIDEWLAHSTSETARARRDKIAAEVANYVDVWNMDEENAKLKAELAATKAVLVEQGAPASELAAPVAPPAPASAPAAAAVLTHTVKRRADPLAAVLKQAVGCSADAGDWASVWASLVVIAQSDSRPAPLLGYVEGDGVKYQIDSFNNPVKFLTREAFRRRWARR